MTIATKDESELAREQYAAGLAELNEAIKTLCNSKGWKSEPMTLANSYWEGSRSIFSGDSSISIVAYIDQASGWGTRKYIKGIRVRLRSEKTIHWHGKDGKFPVPKIVKAIETRMIEKINLDAAKQKDWESYKSAEGLAKAICQRCGVSDYSISVDRSAMNIKIRVVTESQAEAILKAAVACGAIKQIERAA